MGKIEKEQESEKKLDFGYRSPCHGLPVTECPVWILDHAGQAVQVGVSWYCWYGGTYRLPACHKPCPPGEGRNYTMKRFRNLPEDFNQSIWDQAKLIGAVCRYKAGFGFYFSRDLSGQLCCLDASVIAPEQPVKLVAQDFASGLKESPKVQDFDEEVPF